MNLYLACYTQEEIAEKVKVAIGTVNNVLSKAKEAFNNSNGGKNEKPSELKYYNVWNGG